jgi:hypothetical protein
MKLWLDDIRPAPDGWTWAKTAPDAIAALNAGDVAEISMDHDLGEEPGVGTGYNVACWIEEAVATGAFVPPVMAVHSRNSVGAANISRAIASINRLMLRRQLMSIVTSVLRAADPEGLCEHGAPIDEYDGEAVTIVDAITRGDEITAEYIRDVWLVWFGCGNSSDGSRYVGKMPMRDSFKIVADEINDSLELGHDEELRRVLRERRAKGDRGIPHEEIVRAFGGDETT